MAHLLHCLPILFKVFEYKYVDVITIGFLVGTQIDSIHILYVVENTNLDQDAFNANTNYHIIPQYGLPCRYLQRLSSEIRRAKFHFVHMIRDPNEIDLEEALSFQKSYVEYVCKCLEARFSDNSIVLAFKILNPSNMPFKRIDMYSWDVVDLEVLLNHYIVKKEIGDKVLPLFINSNECRKEYFNLKLQRTLDWSDKTFKDVWSMKTWNEPLQKSYANLSQRILTFTKKVMLTFCNSLRLQNANVLLLLVKEIFSIQNVIKTKHKIV